MSVGDCNSDSIRDVTLTAEITSIRPGTVVGQFDYGGDTCSQAFQIPSPGSYASASYPALKAACWGNRVRTGLSAPNSAAFDQLYSRNTPTAAAVRASQNSRDGVLASALPTQRGPVRPRNPASVG